MFLVSELLTLSGALWIVIGGLYFASALMGWRLDGGTSAVMLLLCYSFKDAVTFAACCTCLSP